jgi:hypothetical protein
LLAPYVCLARIEYIPAVAFTDSTSSNRRAIDHLGDLPAQRGFDTHPSHRRGAGSDSSLSGVAYTLAVTPMIGGGSLCAGTFSIAAEGISTGR